MLRWRAAGLTDVGCQRQRNEDNYYLSPDERVFVVADGMGGAIGGAMASQLACQAIEKLSQEQPPESQSQDAISQWLNEAVLTANRSVWHVATEDVSVRGMGTTVLVAVQGDANHLQIAHVGDSRAYLVRDSKATVLTRDHSVVQEMVRAGRLTEEQARINPYKNLITRCLGHDLNVEIDQTVVEVQPGDWIVLCTDGLTTVLHDEEIGSVLQYADDPDKLCQALIQRTLDGGAPDNVTVVAIQYLKEDSNGTDKS